MTEEANAVVHENISFEEKCKRKREAELKKYQENPIKKEELQQIIKEKIQSNIEERKSYHEKIIDNIDEKIIKQIEDLAYQYYFHKDGLHNDFEHPVYRTHESTDIAFIEIVYSRNTIEKTITEQYWEIEELYCLGSQIDKEKWKQILINYVEMKRDEGAYFDFFEVSIFWYSSHLIVELLMEKYGKEIECEEKKDRDRYILDDTEEEVYSLFRSFINFYHDGYYPIEYTKYPLEMIQDVCQMIKIESPTEEEIEKAFSLFIEGLLTDKYPELKKGAIQLTNENNVTVEENLSFEERHKREKEAEFKKYQENPITQEEIHQRIVERMDYYMKNRESYNEECIKMVDEQRKQELYELAHDFYLHKDLHYGMEHPVSRIDMAVYEAFLKVVYSREVIDKTIHEHFDEIKGIYHISKRINEKVFEEIVAEHVEAKREEGHYFDFQEVSIFWYTAHYLLGLLQEKYNIEIDFEETWGNEFTLTETEEEIYSLFQHHINFYHDGLRAMQYKKFPMEAIKDVMKLIEAEHPNLEEIHKAYSTFVEGLLIEKHPALEKNYELKEMLREVILIFDEKGKILLDEQLANEMKNYLQARIVRILIEMTKRNGGQIFIPVSFIEDIEEYVVRKSEENILEDLEIMVNWYLKENYTETNELFVVRKETPFTLGEAVDHSLNYKQKGYPYLVGLVGNELFLSEKEMNISVEELSQLKINRQKAVASNGKVYLCKIKK